MAKWTRRQFVRFSAGAAAAMPMHRLFASSSHEGAGFAYATSVNVDGKGSIQSYVIDGERWTPLEVHPSEAPAFSCLAADGKTLYVANALNVVAGLARGAVTAYRVAEDGRLKLLVQKPLSMGAVGPRHMTISPDGNLLAVAASGGGIYNLIALDQDGSLGEIRAIRKETGCGPHSEQAFAQPHTVQFDSLSGRLLASDFGSDRLSVFAFRGDRLVRHQSLSMEAGSGPGSFVLGEKAVYVSHKLNGRLEVYGYNAQRGALGDLLQSLAPDAGGGDNLAMHPSGHMLYSSGASLKAWKIRNNGQILLAKTFEQAAAGPLVLRADGRALYALHKQSGVIRQIVLDENSGEPLALKNVVASGKHWTSLSILPA